MKDLKLNLLEKKEMDQVRGGLVDKPPVVPKCECQCFDANGHQIVPVNSKTTGDNLKVHGPEVVVFKPVYDFTEEKAEMKI